MRCVEIERRKRNGTWADKAERTSFDVAFEPGEHQRIAVKIVDDRGIESLKIVEVD